MKRTRAEMRADLMRQAEVLVDELLDWNEQTSEPTLTQIEEVVLKLRQRLSEQMAMTVIESQEATRSVPSPKCPTCQVEMHYKDMKQDTVESRVGQLALNRGYYYCETCRTGLFPLDHQLRVWDKHWSEQVAKYAVWLSGLMEYEEAERVLNQVGQIPLSDSSLWRRAQKWGESFKAVEAAQRATATAVPARGSVIRGEARQQPKMGAAMDGAKVYIRKETWKELKVGCIFDLEVRPTPDQQTGDLVDLAHAVQNSYVAHLGGPEVFGERVWTEARRRNWTQAQDTIVLGDGAPWIWNQAQDHFFDSRQGVDWYHATEHLAHAGGLLKGEGTTSAHQWFKAQETPLFEGHADQIAAQLPKAAQKNTPVADHLRREAGYFQDNHRRMQYQELREDGFPIGSGMVESGCKRFRKRFTGAGMRWSRPSIECLIPIRAAIMSHHFDQAWQAAYKSPPN